eukprot:9781734-Alexandrium_andersonii.AAC.1
MAVMTHHPNNAAPKLVTKATTGSSSQRHSPSASAASTITTWPKGSGINLPTQACGTSTQSTWRAIASSRTQL